MTQNGIKQFLKKMLMTLSFPLRYMIRYELEQQNSLYAMQNIRKGLQRMASQRTFEYVHQHMQHIDSVTTPSELLSASLAAADLSGGKLICEFGVYSGRSINHLATETDHTIYGFDSFEGLPERWRDGIGPGSFKNTTFPEVAPNVILIAGWFQDSLPPFLRENDGDMGFIHIDCDLYSSTKTVFDLLKERIKPGCVLVFDEYFNHPSWEEDEYKAFMEFIAETGLKYEYIGYNRLHEQVAVRIIE